MFNQNRHSHFHWKDGVDEVSIGFESSSSCTGSYFENPPDKIVGLTKSLDEEGLVKNGVYSSFPLISFQIVISFCRKYSCRRMEPTKTTMMRKQPEQKPYPLKVFASIHDTGKTESCRKETLSSMPRTGSRHGSFPSTISRTFVDCTRTPISQNGLHCWVSFGRNNENQLYIKVNTRSNLSRPRIQIDRIYLSWTHPPIPTDNDPYIVIRSLAATLKHPDKTPLSDILARRVV